MAKLTLFVLKRKNMVKCQCRNGIWFIIAQGFSTAQDPSPQLTPADFSDNHTQKHQFPGNKYLQGL